MSSVRNSLTSTASSLLQPIFYRRECQRPSGVQPGQCDRSLLRRLAAGSRSGIRVSGFDRRSVRAGRLRVAYGLLSSVRAFGPPAATACVILSVWLRNDLSPRLPKRRGGSEGGKGVRRLVRMRPILIYSPVLSVRCSPADRLSASKRSRLQMRLTKAGPL